MAEAREVREDLSLPALAFLRLEDAQERLLHGDDVAVDVRLCRRPRRGRHHEADWLNHAQPLLVATKLRVVPAHVTHPDTGQR
jgi:hypothetical protein